MVPAVVENPAEAACTILDACDAWDPEVEEEGELFDDYPDLDFSLA